jgi:hypothetical protein
VAGPTPPTRGGRSEDLGARPFTLDWGVQKWDFAAVRRSSPYLALSLLLLVPACARAPAKDHPELLSVPLAIQQCRQMVDLNVGADQAAPGAALRHCMETQGYKYQPGGACPETSAADQANSTASPPPGCYTPVIN